MSHIDTLKTYKEYLAAGYTEQQAETSVHILDKSFDTVATKSDLIAMQLSLHQDMNILRAEIKSDMAFGVMLPIVIGFIVTLGAQALMKKRGWL